MSSGSIGMCCWLLPAPGGRITRRNHMMLTTIQHTGAEQTAAMNTVIRITHISGMVHRANGTLVCATPVGERNQIEFVTQSFLSA
jgi:hypothetical protein